MSPEFAEHMRKFWDSLEHIPFRISEKEWEFMPHNGHSPNQDCDKVGCWGWPKYKNGKQ